MKIGSFLKLTAATAVLGLMALVSQVNQAAAQESDWDRIMRTGVVKVAVIPNRAPYFWDENKEWKGFTAEMSRDIVKGLSVAMNKELKTEWIITSYATVILDIQASKVDFFIGMAFSEERLKALNMFGPMWAVPNVAVNRKDFKIGDTWAVYNRPEVNIAVQMGTTDEDAARKFLPNAKIRGLKGFAETVLDVQSGNSQTFVASVLTGMGALKENPSLGDLVVLQPVFALPSGGGVRRDGDGRLFEWLQGWAWSYRNSGWSQRRIVESMKDAGLPVERLPPDLKF